MRHETSNDAVSDETVTLFNDAFFTHHNHVAMSVLHSVDRVDNCVIAAYAWTWKKLPTTLASLTINGNKIA